MIDFLSDQSVFLLQKKHIFQMRSATDPNKLRQCINFEYTKELLISINDVLLVWWFNLYIIKVNFLQKACDTITVKTKVKLQPMCVYSK